MFGQSRSKRWRRLRGAVRWGKVPGRITLEKRSFTQMDLTTLQEFRQEIYNSFERAGDSLFNTIDALISESQAQSFPELSLSPFFLRSWSSLYKAFKRGQINRE